MSDKQYVGSGWEKKFDTGGEIISISLKKEDLINLPTNNYGSIRLVVARRKMPDQRSHATHTVYVDTYDGSQKTNQPKPQQPTQESTPLPDVDSMDFGF